MWRKIFNLHVHPVVRTRKSKVQSLQRNRPISTHLMSIFAYVYFSRAKIRSHWSCKDSCERLTPHSNLQWFAVVNIALQVARKIASCKSSAKWHCFLHRLLSNQLLCELSWKMVLSQRITQKLHRHKKVSDELLCTRIKITRRWSPAYVYAYMKATIVPVTALVFIFHE